MSQITWKNVNSRSNDGAFKLMSRANDRLVDSVDPLIQGLKDKAALDEENWDVVKDNNTQEARIALNNIKDLATRNQMESDGLLGEQMLKDKFGAQVDVDAFNKDKDASLTKLRDNLKNELYSQAMATADEEEDLLAGGTKLRELAIANGASEKIARGWEDTFAAENAAKGKQYTKSRQGKLLQRVSDIDMTKITSREDLEDLRSDLIESGENIDPNAFYAAAEKSWMNSLEDKERKHQEAQKVLRKTTRDKMLSAVRTTGDPTKAIQVALESGLDNPEGIINSMGQVFSGMSTQTDVQRYEMAAVLQNRQGHFDNIAASQQGLIAAEEEKLAGIMGFQPQYLKQLEQNIESGKDMFAAHNLEGSDIGKDDINKELSYLQNGVIPEGAENAGKKFNFNAKDAKIIAAMTLDQMRGADNAIMPDFIDGDVEDNFRAALIHNASNYRKYQKGKEALDGLKGQFTKDERKWENAQKLQALAITAADTKSNLTKGKVSAASILQGITANTPDGLPANVKNDSRVTNYMATINNIMAAGRGSSQTPEPITPKAPRKPITKEDMEQAVKRKSAEAGAAHTRGKENREKMYQNFKDTIKKIF